MAKAKITVLWIGEEKPDLFSSLIQWVLRKNYSHNAIIFRGEIWHSTIPEFCREPISEALKGSVVRACVTVETRFSEEELAGYLEARRGTPYSFRQGLAAVRPVLFDWPFVRLFFKNGKEKLICSEAVAELCQGGNVWPWTLKALDFGDCDRVTPKDTFKVLGAQKCVHNHLLP